jgi:ParB-like nuclease domain
MSEKLEFHPIAKIFPVLPKKELHELAEDIKENGQRIPIVMHEGKILDGRNRYLACLEAGVELRFRDFPAKLDPKLYVISTNLMRRHLTPRERAAIIAPFVSTRVGRPSKETRSNDRISAKKAAETAHVSEKSVRRAVAARKPAPSKPAEPGWSKEELAKDQELADHFLMIEAVYGANDTKAIRAGAVPMKRADVLTLGKLPKDRMLAIQDLIFTTHWTPKKCIEFLNSDPDDDSTVQDLKYLCLTTKGKYWSNDFSGYTVTVKYNRAAKR